MTLAFNVDAFTVVFTTFLVDTKENVWWTVLVGGTLNSNAFMTLTSFVFTTGIVSNTVDFYTLVDFGITDVEFTIDIEWFAMCTGSAFNSLTLVLETDLLVTTEFTSPAFNFNTLWVSVIGFAITDFGLLSSCRVTWVTVCLLSTVDWLTGTGAFLDLVGIVGVGDDDTVRETFVWGIVAITVFMGATFLFDTFVIMAIVFVLSDLTKNHNKILIQPILCIC